MRTQGRFCLTQPSPIPHYRGIGNTTHSSGRFASVDGLRCPFQRGIRHLRRIRAAPQRYRGPVADMRFTFFVLPKGRKDCGETTEDTAVRETYEGTGSPCKLLLCTIPTRAPPPNINTVDTPRAMKGATEPFTITLRDQNETKMIWWVLTIVNGEREEGTKTASENLAELLGEAMWHQGTIPT